MKILLRSLIVSAALIGGCQSSSRLSGISPVEELPMHSFRQQWTRDLHLKSEKVKALYLADAQLFVHTGTNRLFSLSTVAGDVKFVSQVGDASADVKRPLVLANQIVVSANQRIYFFDKNGRFERILDVGDPLRTALAGSERGLYAGQDHRGGGRTISIDASYQSNPIRWQLEAGGGVYGTPAVAGSRVYFGGLDGHVYATNADRMVLWPQLPDGVFKTGGPILADTKIDGNTLYVASMDGQLYSLDARSGRLRWTAYFGVPLASAPVITPDFVYQYAEGQGVHAISRADTEPAARSAKWTVAEARGFLASDEKFAYLVSDRNRVLAVNKSTGEVAFSSVRKDLVAFATNTKNGVIYAATRDGLIFAITPVLRPGTSGQLALELQATRL